VSSQHDLIRFLRVQAGSAPRLEHRDREPFMEAYEHAIRETSTHWAPWYVVPADHNWVRNLAVAELLVSALERLDPKLPEPDPGVDPSDLV
jgi:hypothetical protein